MDNVQPPSIHVISLGGTIAMVPGSRGVVPGLSGTQLVAAVPGVGRDIEVTVETALSVPGASLTFDDLVTTLEQARTAVTRGAAGVVITQGTDTIEETAYALDLLWDRDEPLVVTGAMRPPHVAGADGPGNIAAAVATAASPDALRRGCLVVIADEIHAAHRVAKVHSSRLSAFASPGTGPIGLLVEGAPHFWAPPPRRSYVSPTADRPAPDVVLVTVVLGGDGRHLEAAGRDADGVVLATMGAGHVPAAMLPTISSIAQRIPMAMSTRTGSGPVLQNTYAFPGSERDLHGLGILDAGELSPLKARVLLTLAIWGTTHRFEQEAVFRAVAGAT